MSVVEGSEVYLIETPLKLAMPLPSSSKSNWRSEPRNSSSQSSSFGSITNSMDFWQHKNTSLEFETPINRKAVDEAIDRYRAGKPVGENQQHIVVSSFQTPSGIQRDPIGETLNIALLVIFIASLLSLLRTVFGLLAVFWQRNLYTNLQNQLILFQEQQFQIVSNPKLRNMAQNLQRGAIETYIAYSNGTLSREECRQKMIECFFVLPEVVDMMFSWIDTKTPLPDSVEEASKKALASNRINGSLPLEQRLSPDQSPPPFPPPPLPPPPRRRPSGKSFIFRVKSFGSRTSSGLSGFLQRLTEPQFLLGSLIVLFALLWLFPQ